MFHIHVDATSLDRAFEEHLVRTLGFWRSDFSHQFADDDGFEPAHHLTQKPATSVEFQRLFDGVVKFATTHPGALRGYVEGEFIALDEDIDEKAYDPSIPPPFSVSLTRLALGAFRETEIHISLDKDHSDPRLCRALKEMGFFAGFIPKSYGVAEVLTVQGSREHVRQILPPVLDFLRSAGGSAHCSVKEERVAKWWVSDPDIQMPPVVESIRWLSPSRNSPRALES